MAGNIELINSVYNKRLEIHYDEYRIRDRDNKPIKLELQGKIRCPLLNTNISSLTCSKLMEKSGWPRQIDDTVCKRCGCYVYLSISKFKAQKEKSYDTGKPNTGTTIKKS